MTERKPFVGVLPLPCGCRAGFTDRTDDDGKGIVEFNMCHKHIQECIEHFRKVAMPKFLYGEGEQTIPWRKP